MRRKRLSKGARFGLRVSLLSVAVGLLAWEFRQPLGLTRVSTVIVGTAGACLSGWVMAYEIQRRRRRRLRGKRPCVHCGYELTGNTSGICPECGEVAHYKLR